MKGDGDSWFDGLLDFSAQCRLKRALGKRESLSPAQECQCRIIGGSLIAWLQKFGPALLQEREVLAELHEAWEVDPFVVFTSNEPGLVAAREILQDGPKTIAFLHPEEFAEWCEKCPDEEYRWHVHTWSLFTSTDDLPVDELKKYALGAGECFWLHSEGTQCGPLFGRGGEHLWKWNGEAPKLLKEAIDEWVS